VLSNLAHRTVCRSIQLLVLLARGETAKDLETPCPPSAGARAMPPAPRPKPEPADRTLLAAISTALAPGAGPPRTATLAGHRLPRMCSS
jgi:hypothetical protein